MLEKLMKKQIKNRYLTYFVLIGLFMGCFFGAVVSNVKGVGSVVGDYYLEDFIYSDGLRNFTSTSNGVDWLTTKACGIYAPAGYGFRINNNNYYSYISVNQVAIAFLNLSILTSSIHAHSYGASTATGGTYYNWELYTYYKNSANLNVFYTKKWAYKNVGGTSTGYSVYNSNGVSIYAGASQSTYEWINLSFSNTSVLLKDAWGLHIIPDMGNFDYITSIEYYSTCSLYTGVVTITDISIEYLSDYVETWETGLENYSSYGSVIENTDSITSYSICGGNTMLSLEEQNDYLVTGEYRIRQIAYALDYEISTNYSLMQFSLYFGSTSLGSYDSVYVTSVFEPKRYILVWDNINFTVDTDNVKLLFELLIVKTTYCANICVLQVQDIEPDSDEQYTYSYESTINGIFGGTWSILVDTSDFMYKVWYEDMQVQNDIIVDGNNSICLGSTSALQQENDKYYEFETVFKFTGILNVFDIEVYKDQINDISNDINDYTLYINGEYQNKADYIIRISDNYYKIRFLINALPIDNEIVVVELSCSKYSQGFWWWEPKIYWYYGRCIDNAIVDKMYFHNDVNKFGDGSVYKDDSYNSFSPAMCLWYTDYVINPDFNNTIGVYPDSNVFKEYETCAFTGTISDFSNPVYIKLYKDGVRLNKDNFDGNGYEIEYPDYSFFIPFVFDNNSYNGVWNVSLYQNGVELDNVEFTVVDRDNYNNVLWTDPNPSNARQQFIIGWLFNYTLYGTYGAILYNTEDKFTNSLPVVIDELTGDGSIPYTFYNDGIYYFFLCTKRNNRYNNIGGSYPHYVGVSSANDIFITKNPLQLEKHGELIYGTQTIYGTHTYAGKGDVRIFDGIKEISKVPNSPYNVKVDFYESGNHNLSLVVFNNQEVTYLDSVGFIANDYVPSEITNFISGLSNEVKLFIGIFIILFLTLLPTLLLSILAHEVKISFLLTFIFFIVSVVLCIILSLIPPVVLGVIIFCLILSLVLVYFIRNKSES